MSFLRWWSISNLVLALIFAGGCGDPKGRKAKAAAAKAERKKKKKAKQIKGCAFNGSMRSDATLYARCSPYVIQGGIDVLDNSTLTIEAGVEVRFADGDWLEIAAASTRGARLIAKGTAEHPILLTAADDDPSRTWLGVWIAEGTREAILSHVIIRAAGGSNKFLPVPEGCLTFTDVHEGTVTVDEVRLESCRNAAVVARHGLPSLRWLTIVDSPAAFLLDGVAPSAIPADVRYERVPRILVEGQPAQ